MDNNGNCAGSYNNIIATLCMYDYFKMPSIYYLIQILMSVWKEITTVRRMLDVKMCKELKATHAFVTQDLREMGRYVQVC